VTQMSKVNFLIYNNYTFKKNLKSEPHTHTLERKEVKIRQNIILT